MPNSPSVELLWWEGCPSTPAALSELRNQMADLGLDPQAISVREITSDEEAASERFAGSPTVLIDGEDVVPPAGDDPIGLSCRVYRTEDGRASPLPPAPAVRAALERALRNGAAE